MIQQLTKGIEDVMIDDLAPAIPMRFGDDLALCRYEQMPADDGEGLEEMLWKKGADDEKTGKESAWMHRLMFSTCRSYRRIKQLNIRVNPDPSIEAMQKRWEVGGQVLNEIVDRLYRSRKELALVVYRAAQSRYSRCVALPIR